MKQIIMLLTNEYGPDVRVYKEAKYLLNRGFKITVLCWDRGSIIGLPQHDFHEGIEIIRYRIPSKAGTGRKQLKAFLKYIKKSKAYLRGHACDYLHCHDIDGAIAGYIGKKKNTPMIFDMHEFYEHGEGIIKYMWRLLTIFLLKKSIAGIRVNSLYCSSAYKSVSDKLILLKNYPDSNIIEARPKSISNVLRISYNGAVRGQIPEFIALFEAVKDLDDVVVNINGGGIELEELKEISALYDNVHINGPYDGTLMSSKLYEETDVLYCAYDPMTTNNKNNGETEPVKYFEAIFTGTPLIGTKGIYYADQAKKNGYGIACNTRNSDEVRDAILKYKHNQTFWDFCHNNELNDAAKYDWNKAVKVLDIIYKK